MHVIFCGPSTYQPGTNPCPVTCEQHLMATYKTATHGTYGALHLDAYRKLDPNNDGNGLLIEGINQERPDFVVVSMNPPDSPHNINRNTLRLVREMGIPLVGLWWDSVPLESHVNQREDEFDLNVQIDSSYKYKRFARNPANWIALFPPYDTSVFYDAGLERDLDLVFIGSIERYSERVDAVKALEAAGITLFEAGTEYLDPERCRLLMGKEPRLFHAGGYDDDMQRFIETADYARYLQRAKIGLNFSNNVGSMQLKGRAYEVTHCGALLLDANNDETDRRFAVSKEFFDFSAPGGMVDAVKFFLRNDKERIKTAKAGNTRAARDYNEAAFWGPILERLKI